MKLLTIVGARPQFIKAAVVSRAIDERKARGQGPAIEETLVHTGQHYDPNMSEVFFREMGLRAPAYNLEVAGGSHGAMTGRMLERVEVVLLRERPDAVLVYGDTNSTLAGALAAAKLGIPVAHVEAGLRSFNTGMPEEINRVAVDHMSRWLLCPTVRAVQNLRTEGLPEARIRRVGDVMYDAALFYARTAQPSPGTRALLDELADGFALGTVHRAESTDHRPRLEGIFAAAEEIAAELPVVVPLHPRTRNQLAAFGVQCRRVRVVEPVGYFDMLSLLQACDAVLTDSGGVQKEAFFFAKPCLTLREETEWVELVELGVNVLGGTQTATILEGWRQLRSRRLRFDAKPYGDGNAGAALLAELLK